MKKILITLLVLVAFMPNVVKAKEREKITVYMFYGDGCPHCAKAEAFFDKIEEEYGKYYELKEIETWRNKLNADIVNEVWDEFKVAEDKRGVPYIVIGDKTYMGFGDTNDEKEDIINTIVNQYNNEEYEDRIINIYNKHYKAYYTELFTMSASWISLGVLVLINEIVRIFLPKKRNSQ